MATYLIKPSASKKLALGIEKALGKFFLLDMRKMGVYLLAAHTRIACVEWNLEKLNRVLAMTYQTTFLETEAMKDNEDHPPSRENEYNPRWKLLP